MSRKELNNGDTGLVIRTNINGNFTELYTVVDPDTVSTNIDYSVFNPLYVPTGSEEVGTINYNSEDDTFNGVTSDNIYQFGQELSPRYRNATGSLIPNGTPVMFNGVVGASGIIKLQPALADGSILPAFTLGITTVDIANDSDGKVTWFGKVRNITIADVIDSTSTAWQVQDLLYVSPVEAGKLTNTRPSPPNYVIVVGTVLSVTGSMADIASRPTWYDKLEDLSDINGTPLTTNGQIVVWNNDNGYHDFNYNILNRTSTFNLAGLSVGTETNNTTIEADGTIVFNGNATVWDDINVGGVSLTQGTVNKPSLITLNTSSVLTYAFEGTTNVNELHGSFELSHTYKEGTDILPHAHFYLTSTATGDIKINLDYYIIDGESSSNVLTGTLSDVQTATGTAWDQLFFSFGSITGTTLTIGAQIHFRIYRDPGDAADTYTDDVAIGTFGVHHEIDTVGSRQEITK